MELDWHITRFVEAVGSGAVEVCNEFSLQHELGVYLRSNLDQCRVQFERNVSHFHLAKTDFEKKEIDIAITCTPSGDPFSAIELKYPRNGQVPESMFSICEDIAFLEQLVWAGFESAYFLAVADDGLFYSGSDAGIYGLFRSCRPITGRIRKPTSAKDKEINIKGSYNATWLPISLDRRYCLVRVGN
jgi:hypothetical protein